MADIIGTPGNDVLTGTPGNDYIDGLAGADDMTGGAGDDTYVVDNALDVVHEANGEGDDRIYATVDYILTAGSFVEILAAGGANPTAAINLTGNAFANSLWGNEGANRLDGKAGDDFLFGYGGDDTLFGGDDNDFLVGGEGADTLLGQNGADVLIGEAGNDYLDGGTGADLMSGGAGDDVYVVDDAGEAINEALTDGSDRVYALVDYILTAGAYIEILQAGGPDPLAGIDLGGNELTNNIWGNEGANVIDGRNGDDFLFGFGGDDTLFGGEGADFMVGGLGNDTLLGGNGADNLIGLEGNDYLDGAAGADLMSGGDGDDVYVVDDAGEAINETLTGGNDRVYALVDYILTAGAYIEVLQAGGPDPNAGIDLGGNELTNNIWGNEGANAIDGRNGDDFLFGFGGDDTLFGGEGADFMVGGTGNDTLLGQNGIDVLVGEAGNDYLDGASGADTMNGGAGDDLFVVDNVLDVIQEAAGEGSDDRVFASLNYTLGAGVHVEVLAAGGPNPTAIINLTGNELANSLWGNAGANILDGGGGNDTVLGFDGNDTLFGGDGNDLLLGGNGADIFAIIAVGAATLDTIGDFVAGTDKIRLGGGAGEPFVALATGFLTAGTFVIGAAALDANDYLIYNSGTGALMYDADGNGAGAAVQIATLATGLGLAASDFTVSGPANNSPSVTSGPTASIAENSPASTIVYQTIASDADGDRITYSLSGTDAALLNIDVLTGAVRLNASADYETKPSYSFNVVASDSGSSHSRGVSLLITNVAEASTPIINEVATPNDSTATAQTINRSTLLVATNPNLPDDDLPSARIVGNMPTSTDKDFFAITLQAGEKLILDVDNSSGDLDTHLRVYNSSGTEIGDNDDAGALDPGSAPHPVYGHNTDSFFSFRAPTSGTYYFSIESFQDAANPTFGSYEINVSVGPPATQAQIIEEDIQAMLSGLEWGTTNITYSFPNSASDYPPGFGDPEDPEPVSFAPFTAAQQTATQTMLQYIASLTGITFQQLTGASDGDAKLRYAMTDATEAAHAYYPGSSDEAGSLWFNKDDFNAPAKGNYAWMGILHETGHALGLKHGHEAPALSMDRDSVEYSVMTYRSYPGAPLTGYVNEQWGFPQTLMMYDIAALQRIYGANFNTNTGDTVYAWNQNTAEMSINGAGQGAPGSNRLFMTLWDGGGNDTYDLSGYLASDHILALTIDLRPGEWSTFSNFQRANLGQGNQARGNVANALLFEGDPRSLIENAIGSLDTDVIIANQAANRMTGGGVSASGDLFKWMSASDAGTGALADTVTDFVHNRDGIGLADIDAIAGGADNAFTFIGTGAFTNTAGQLRYEVQSGSAHVFADIDGNGIADMEIILSNVTVLTSNDFFL